MMDIVDQILQQLMQDIMSMQKSDDEWKAINERNKSQGGSNSSMNNVQDVLDQFMGEESGGAAGALGKSGAGLGEITPTNLAGGPTVTGGTGATGGSSVGGTVSGGGGSSGLGGAGTAAGVAAAIAGQHALSEATDTVYEGQKTEDVFSGNFFTEPWMAYANQQLGIEPSPGEKMDAAIERSDWGTALARSPETAWQWFDPVGDFLYGVTDEYIGEGVADVLFPASWASRKVTDLFEDWF